MLHSNKLPRGLLPTIRSKTEGNPLFIEEVVRTLIEQHTLVRDAPTASWRANRHLQN
jgi:predicted ATPase